MPKSTNYPISRPKRVYIEATTLTRQQGTGMAYLAAGLIQGLIDRDPEAEYIFFHFGEGDSSLRVKAPHQREIIIQRIKPKLFRLLYLIGLAPSVEWLTGESDIETIIFPNFYAWPVRSRAARIFPLVADTVFADHPEYVEHYYFRALLRRGVKFNARVAATVLTCSQSTARRLEQLFSIPREKIVVIYPGYKLPQAKPKATASTKTPKHYLLFVGTLDPRKNIAGLIQAYLKLPSELRSRYQLLLAGGKGWYDDEIQALIRQHVDDGVTALGYVTDSHKAALYSRATAFVYPALYEGFGMPIIEAQAYGLPVVTCNNTSLPEAAGTAALYTEPDAASLSAALERILTDASLRRRLSKASRQHAAEFSWSRSAAQLHDLLWADRVE